MRSKGSGHGVQGLDLKRRFIGKYRIFLIDRGGLGRIYTVEMISSLTLELLIVLRKMRMIYVIGL